MKISKACLVLLLGFFSASLCSADDTLLPPHLQKGRLTPQDRKKEADAAFKKYVEKSAAQVTVDYSGEGRVDDADKQIVKDFMRRARAENARLADANGDGTITEAEKTAWSKKCDADTLKWRAKTDTNKDGIVDPAEEAKAMALWEKSHPNS